jgi:hypothetical protein
MRTVTGARRNDDGDVSKMKDLLFKFIIIVFFGRKFTSNLKLIQIVLITIKACKHTKILQKGTERIFSLFLN